MPALEVVDRGLVKVSSQLPPPLGAAGGLWKGQCQPGEPQRHPGRPRAPTGMKASNAKFKCQVDRDRIVLGSGTAWGAAGTTPGAQALELGLEAGGTLTAAKSRGGVGSAVLRSGHAFPPPTGSCCLPSSGQGHVDGQELP